MANPLWRTVGKLMATAVISGAGMEAGRRALHGFFDKAGWTTPKDTEQDDELKDVREELQALRSEVQKLRSQLGGPSAAGAEDLEAEIAGGATAGSGER